MSNFRLLRISSLLLLTCVLLGCEPFQKEQQFTIGFSQCISNDAWRKAMHQEMYRELSFYPELTLSIKDAHGNNGLQIQQVREFMEEKVDLLIISPNESEPLTPVVEEAYLSGIPVIVLDRKINSNQYSAYVGGDNFEIGYTAGQYIRNLLGGQGKLIEIWGLRGSSPARERHRGLLQALHGSQIEIVGEIEGQWEKDTARIRLREYLSSKEHPGFDLIFGHNDVMAMGSFEVCKEYGLSDKKYIGVDALPGPYGGIQGIAEGILTASFLYPTGGDKAIEVAHTLLTGGDIDKENILQTAAVDSTNIRIMKQQTDKILAQQSSIFRQREMIDNQVELYRSQRGLLVVFGITLFVAMVSLAYVFKSLKDKQEINGELKQKNQEILDQQAKLVEFAKKAEEATRYKLEFFTNISHEFRTPLTLIQGPLEELVSREDTRPIKNELNLMRKNADRLLKLVNQLMDFRKIDNGKMQVHARLIPLVPFIEEIMSVFRKTANDLKVHFKLETDTPNLEVWMDPQMMDKVMFNLLSNAFKFIPTKGQVHIHLDQDLVNHEAVIRVEDNGPGMKEEELAHVFDRFYQGVPGERKSGTGLGLALSKELLELHQGTIKVTSKPGARTVFEIRLKLGNMHFEPSQLEPMVQEAYFHLENEDFMDKDAPLTQEKSMETSPKSHKILLVEDDPEIRSYLKKKLENEYEILEAELPEIALAIIHEQVPDLITCDLMLNNKSGLELIQQIKSDNRTSHIPIIIISAKASPEEQLQGVRLGVDDYFTKPFSTTILLERIKVLLEEREKLKAHYLHELPSSQEREGASTRDSERRFLISFKALVEKNISNPNFGVQEICSSLGISRGQLYRRSKTSLGYSVHDYIQRVRLKKARYLLLNAEDSIGEVAFQVGFKTGAYFSTAFKNAYGLTPSEFRENSASGKV
jgi:signal transduction histidine kinase/CheY-like chemotaxis protein/AraC-like DNA-binding protein